MTPISQLTAETASSPVPAGKSSASRGGTSIRSMTGQGAGSASGDAGTVAVELRSVNHRGLRVVPRLSEILSAYETRFEQLLRSRLKRGSVQASVRFEPAASVAATLINTDRVAAYARQLASVREAAGVDASIDLTGLLQLPGALKDADPAGGAAVDLWPLVEAATIGALESLDAMRAAEGAAMADSLLADAERIRGELAGITGVAPQVVEQYRDRLESRLRRLLDERGIDIATPDILREVQLFADRCDISEEITRLTAHLQMFAETLGSSDAGGRKLDFIIQEMFRETNTIGSKASDTAIAARVVEIKCGLERMRELVQNLE